MEDDQLTFVVADGRNAPKVVSGPIVHASPLVPTRPGIGPASSMYVRAPHAYAQPTTYSPYGWGTTPSYQPAPGYMPYPFLGGLFGNLNMGDVIEIVGDVIAAFKKRPDAPTPTGDLATDLQNTVQFIGAIADHVDGKDKLRLGHDVGKLMGAR